MWEDIGTELTTLELDKLIKSNKGITLVGFMGGQPKLVNALARIVKEQYKLKTGWYTGMSTIPECADSFDYIKVGPYIAERGGLDNPNTNQRLFKIDNNNRVDITNKFWKL